LFSSSSASSSKQNEISRVSSARDNSAAAGLDQDSDRPVLAPSLTSNFRTLLPLLMPQATPDPITTYAANCTTPKSTFNLGDEVCAKVAGISLAFKRSFSWVDPSGIGRQVTPITTDPQTDSLTVPTTDTSIISGVFIADNIGTWKVNVVSSRNAVVFSQTFIVKGATPIADLSLVKSINGGSPDTGTNFSYNVAIKNAGPNAATSVTFTDPKPLNATYVRVDQLSGPAFTCDETDPLTLVCTNASLAAGDTALLKLTYTASGGAGTEVNNVATVSSATTERYEPDNTASSGPVTIAGGTGATEPCVITCPADIVVTANASQGGVAGAFVSYSAATVSGSCGTVTNAPASGTFFAAGTHTVTSTSQTGPSCTFTVKVVNTAPPTISCPTDKTATAGPDGTATVNPGTPSFTPADGTIKGVRSDSIPAVYDADGTLITAAMEKPLTDPYPTGLTGITWTVTDADGRTASCKQRINVDAVCPTDTEAPTIKVADDFKVIRVGTGAGNTGCSVSLDDELGQPEATDNCSVRVSISGIPAGNDFPVGTTHLVYTATDPSGNTATDTQDVIVVDDSPPHIAAPADASYVCPSQVPAANVSQATRGDVFDGDGTLLPPGPPFDNCGTPTVTVGDTDNGGAGSTASPLIITRTFTATDGHGNSASAVQRITVADGIPPTISAPASASYQCASQVPAASGSQASASDNCATPNVTVADTSNGGIGSTASPLVITRTYTATDAAGNSASASQTITVIDNTAPTIALTGPNPQYVECHTSYGELGATANDNCGNFAATPSGTVGVDTPGSYTITYNASDAAGNAATPVTRTVIVRDTIKPVITRNGPSSVTVECHTSYSDAGATASDSCDTSVPVITSGTVNVNTVGTYTLTYNASDDSGNAADAVTRTVTVVDTTPPTMAFDNLTIFFNNLTVVFNTNTVTFNGTTYPFNGTSCTHEGYTFSFNGQTVSVTNNGHTYSYTFSGKSLVLWTPTHQYQTVTVANLIASAGDSCSTGLGQSNVVISQVSSDEPQDIAGGGDGNTLSDIVIAPDCKSVQLRAERNGNGNGRVYTITFKVSDGFNTTTLTSKLKIFAGSLNVVDDGAAAGYTVNSNCP
jgi:uncharacterized repeat protein (TIGR01451 family)